MFIFRTSNRTRYARAVRHMMDHPEWPTWGKRRSLALSRPAAGATPTAPWAFRTADGLTPHPACLMVFLDSL